MAKNSRKIIFTVFLIQFITEIGAESTEGIQDKENESFKNLPTLIEYVLDMLHRKPEVLETDDINVFKRSADDNDCETTAEACSTETIYKRAADKYDSPANNSPFKHINKYSAVNAVKKNSKVWDSNDTHEKPQSHNNGEPNSLTKIESKNHGKVLSDSNMDLDYDEIYAVDTSSTVRRSKWSVRLSPGEVEEQILKIDQMIEDYNSKESNE